MKTKLGFIEKTIKNLKEVLILTAFAEEENTSTSTTQNQYQVNYEDLIAKARKEEKEKLYPQITSLKEEVKTLTEKSNNHLLTVEAKDREIAELKKEVEVVKTNTNKSDDEKVKALENDNKKLQKKIEELEKSTVPLSEIETKVREELRAEYEVKLYREQVLRESVEKKEGLIPELVLGSTKEDIDKSLEQAKKRFNDIISTQFNTIPPATPSNSRLNTKDVDLTELAKLDPRSPEYRSMRQKLGLK